MRLGALPAPSPSLGRTARVRDSPKTRLRRRGRAGRDRRPGARRPGGRAGTDRQRHLRHRPPPPGGAPATSRSPSSDGRLCADVPGGTVNPWDAIIGQNDIALVDGRDVRASRFSATGHPGQGRPRRSSSSPSTRTPSTSSANPELSVSGNDYTYTFTSAGRPAQRAGRVPDRRQRRPVAVLPRRRLAARAAPTPEVYVPDTGPRVRVNQVGYLPDGPEERHPRHRGDRRRCRGS